MNKKILVISSFATDEVHYKKYKKTIVRPGGPGYWISQTLKEFQIKARLVNGKKNAQVQISTDGFDEQGSVVSIHKIFLKQKESAHYIFVSTIVDEFSLDDLRKTQGDIILDIQGYVRALRGKKLEISEDSAKRIIILKATKKEYLYVSKKTKKQIKSSILLISDGSRGVTIITKERKYVFPSMMVASPDTIGAGDVFMTAFAAGFIRGDAIPKAGKFAIQYVANYLSQKQATFTLERIFGKKEDIIIGAIHFPPLLGYRDFPGFDVALKNALDDINVFEKGGADGVIIENNYDIPHTINASPSVVSSLAFLTEKIKSKTNLPIGISVLWNDYRTALSIAKIFNLQFVRIPVFVDTVQTDYGIIKGQSKDVIDFRKSIHAEDIAIFTDVHVKHAKLLSQDSLVNSAKRAVDNESDAIIVTGKWTGNAPAVEEVKMIRNCIGNFPILIGSGLDVDNVKKLFNFANGAIVSTSLKQGLKKASEVNVKSYQQRIDQQKVSELVDQISP